MFRAVVTFAGLLLFEFPEHFIKTGKKEGERNYLYLLKLLRSKAIGIQHVAVVSLVGELVSFLAGKKKSPKC